MIAKKSQNIRKFKKKKVFLVKKSNGLCDIATL